jgi:hypothetical protein
MFPRVCTHCLTPQWTTNVTMATFFLENVAIGEMSYVPALSGECSPWEAFFVVGFRGLVRDCYCGNCGECNWLVVCNYQLCRLQISTRRGTL